MQRFVVVERVQETAPMIWEEPEVRMLATPDWFEHRHRIVAEQEAERREVIMERVRIGVLFVLANIIIFGACWLGGGY